MKCCVPLCGNTGENDPITVPVHNGRKRITITSLYNVLCGITFHRFPTPGSQRAVWLEMLGLTESDLPPGAAVCSDHFKRNDFTVMNDGIIKLNKDSIPFQFCMICLASGHSKMYPMSQNYLEKAYTSLTGIAVSYIRDKINTQPRVCVECAQRLVNCDRFRNKGLRAYKSLMQIVGNDKLLTLNNLKSINRVENLLISNIAKHTFEPDHCDLHVKCYEEDNTIYSEEEYNSDIKGNIDMTKVEYKEEVATDFDVVHLNESDDFQNDIHAANDINIDNNFYNDDIKIAGLINYDIQVKYTNFNNDDNTNYCDAGLSDDVAQVKNEDKFDDDIIMNSDVTNVTNNEHVVFMISDSADEVKSLEDDIEHDIDNDIDIDDDVEDGFADSMNNYHNNGLLSENYVKLFDRLKDKNKSENRVSLSNIIFVKDSCPIIQNEDFIPRIVKTNKNLQIPRVYSDTKCKNINNAQTITNNNQNTVESFKERKENNKINSLSDVFQETQNRSNIQNKDKVLNNVKQEITKSNNKKRPTVLAPKKNSRQLSSKSKIVKASVPKPKRQKKPKPCVPKPKKKNSISKMFTKTILTYEEQLAEIQRRQHTKHYKSYPYKCDICFTGCWSLFTYNRHMDRHTDKHGKWECAVCGLRKETRTRLRFHVQSHLERYSCKRCNFVTRLSTLLINHARWHSGLAFKCPHCEATFSKKSSYFSHLRVKHPSDCACPLCGFSFVSEKGVKAHTKLSHRFEDVQNLSGPSCAQCNVRFASEAAYDTHMAVSPKHVSSGIPRRNECTDIYKPVGPVQKRQRRLLNEELGTRLCEICGKSFHCASVLNAHMNVHAGVKFKCDFCNKSYLRQINLTSHIQSAHSDNPKRYPCSVCHKEFSFYSNRQRHMLTHDPTKRPWYTCDICNKSFTTLDFKVKHVAHVHNNVPWPKRHRPQRRAHKRKYSADDSDSHDANVTDTDVDGVSMAS